MQDDKNQQSDEQKKTQNHDKKNKKKASLMVKQKTGVNLITSQPAAMQSSMYQKHSPPHLRTLPVPYKAPMPAVSMPYYPTSSYNYKTMNDWNCMGSIASGYQMSRPVYNVNVPPLPIAMSNPRPVLSSQGVPYASIPMPPMLTDSTVNVYDLAARYNQIRTYYGQKTPPDLSPKHNRSLTEDRSAANTNQYRQDNMLSYLRLSNDLFPAARQIEGDPNTIIDELCKADNPQELPFWILDLEFGIPKGKTPVTRHIATYDVHNNTVVCKGTPNVLHPSFERCSESLKYEVLHYYDCVFSTWYRGYVSLYNDRSLTHFQKWVQVPCQCFGMCWP